MPDARIEPPPPSRVPRSPLVGILIGALFVMFTGIEWAWRRKKNLA